MESIRKMMLEDLKEVIALHLKSFQGFFLSFLGPRFLELFYEEIILSPQGVGLVYINNNKREGFVCGAINPSQFYRNILRKKGFHFILASLGAIIKKPSIIPRLWRARYQPSSSLKGNDKATLMSLGVNPRAQNKGIGKILVQKFLKELKLRGVQEINLTTDRLNNENVNEFYKKLGFILRRHYTTPEGREMNEFVLTL